MESKQLSSVYLYSVYLTFTSANYQRSTKTLTMYDVIWYTRLDDKDLKSQKYLFLTFNSINIIMFMLLLLLISNSLFYKAFAASPAFDEVLITDKRPIWIQTHGNDSTHLKSGYANILAVGYVSDGKSLNATLWLKSNSEMLLHIVNLLSILDMACLLLLFHCLKIQDLMEPITTFILKQLMESGVNIFTNYHQQVLVR